MGWVPSQWQNEDMIYKHVAKGRHTVIPYHQNRFVLFNSKLFHKTDNHRFKKGLTNRRINLTFLFGQPTAEGTKNVITQRPDDTIINPTALV